MGLTRREVLVGLAAGSLVRCAGVPIAPAPAGRFPLGVGAHDPLPGGALLWTRYDGAAGLTALVWRADDAGDSISAMELDVAVAEGGYATVEVEGLQPGTRYAYAFVEGGMGRSPDGRFRTAPAPGGLPTVRLGATCCTKLGHSFEVLERAGERDDLDAFLLLGDTVYCDDAHAAPEFRDRWSVAMAQPGYRALRASSAVIATWDDHEFNNDWSADTIAPDRFAAASRAWFEHLPMRRDRLHPDRIWRSFRFGETAEVFVLDARSERVRSTGRYLSDPQLDWLKRGLEGSPARFKVIMNSVPISQFSAFYFAHSFDDRWEAFPATRDAILRHVDDSGIGGVLWVAGDFHLASAGRVSSKGLGSTAVEVLVGPGAQQPNPAPSYPAGPQFDWSSGKNNYATLELDPGRGEVEVQWVDRTGKSFQTRRYRL